MNWLCLVLIDFYQTFISPYKGFRCAYAVAHSSDSCSDAIKSIIATNGLWAGLPLIRAQFAACSTAYATLESTRRQRNNQTNNNRCQSLENVAECAELVIELINPCDIGSCEIGSCSF